MYPTHLLTTLSLLPLLPLLPLTILAAPAPAPQLELPKGPAVYYIMGTKSTLRGGRVISSEKSGHWIQKDFAVTVKGDTLDAANVLCTGKLAWEGTDDGNDEALSRPQTAQLACADGQVHVDVTTDAGEGAAETYGVKDRDLPRAAVTVEPGCHKNALADSTECTSQGPSVGPKRIQSP